MLSIRKAFPYIALMIISIVWLVPFVSTIWMSLKTNKELASNPFWNPPLDPIKSFTANILDAWNNQRMTDYFTNSLIYATTGSVIATLLASIGALPMSRGKTRGAELVFYLLLFVTFFPFQIYIIPLLDMFVYTGLYNTFLGMEMVYIAITIPFVVFVMRNYYATIPDDLEDAAKIDGLSYFGMYRKIFLPLSLPAIAVGVIFQWIWIWNEFLIGLVLTHTTARPVQVGLYNIQGALTYSFSTQATAALVAAIPVIVMFLIFQRFITRGILAGAVKG